MWLNVIVTGGCAKIPGLVERLAREIRQFAPAIYPVSVRALDDPISDVFLGLSLLSSTDDDDDASWSNLGTDLQGEEIVLEDVVGKKKTKEEFEEGDEKELEEKQIHW